MTITYQGDTINFNDLFYQYIAGREGFRNVVYADVYGNATVGIGHLVTSADGLNIGDTVTNDTVQALYNTDYQRMGIEPYAQEVITAGYSYNMALAVGSFIWAHGAGGYKDSNLRQGLINGTYDASSIQTYLAANWDTRKPADQARNAKDFTIGFSATPWTTSVVFNAVYGLSGTFPRVADWVKNNALIITSIVIVMIIILLIMLYRHFK